MFETPLVKVEVNENEILSKCYKIAVEKLEQITSEILNTYDDVDVQLNSIYLILRIMCSLFDVILTKICYENLGNPILLRANKSVLNIVAEKIAYDVIVFQK
ncbi:MAG: hypothetical protein QXI09_03480 [Candidatus Aenigmatarchaeota archaeon]